MAIKRKTSDAIKNGGVLVKLDSQLSDIMRNSSDRVIRTDSIAFNPDNDFYREDDSEESIRHLADRIWKEGLTHNIAVSARAESAQIDGKEFVMLSGERRLRAIQLLAAEHPENQNWNTVAAKVYVGLSTRQEQIILDSANLEVRGGISDEKILRKAMNRYIQNLQDEYGATEKEAVAYLKKSFDISQKTAYRNMQIQHNLSKGLTELLDEKKITKVFAFTAAGLSEEHQNLIEQTIREGMGCDVLSDAAADAAEKRSIGESFDLAAAIASIKKTMKKAESAYNADSAEVPDHIAASRKAEEEKLAAYVSQIEKINLKVTGIHKKMPMLVQLEANHGAAQSSVKSALEKLNREIQQMLEEF